MRMIISSRHSCEKSFALFVLFVVFGAVVLPDLWNLTNNGFILMSSTRQMIRTPLGGEDA